jgi:predicted transcriptional regulator
MTKNFVNWDKRTYMKRDKAIETVKEFPQEFEVEDLIERLVFLEKVEKGLQQVEHGKTVPHEKVKEMTKKW